MKRDEVNPTHDLSFIKHADTRHLRWSRVFASLIAFYQNRDELCLPDLVAGIYVTNYERVMQFWPRGDVLEDFVAEKCGWSEPRWLTWQRWEHEMRTAPRQFRIPFLSGIFSVRVHRRFVGHHFKPSAQWTALFHTAEALTPMKVTQFGRLMPLLTIEIMLLALARSEDTPFAESFRATGAMVDKIEEAVRRPVENPEGTLAAVEQSGDNLTCFIRRHVQGDWGELCADDIRFAPPPPEGFLSPRTTKYQRVLQSAWHRMDHRFPWGVGNRSEQAKPQRINARLIL
jgi:hypothetical protein